MSAFVLSNFHVKLCLVYTSRRNKENRLARSPELIDQQLLSWLKEARIMEISSLSAQPQNEVKNFRLWAIPDQRPSFHKVSAEPLIWQEKNKKLTNLELLSFLTVLAFPNASKMGLVWMIWSSRDALPTKALPVAPTLAKYPMTFLVFSVLPAPDSPLEKSEKANQVERQHSF